MTRQHMRPRFESPSGRPEPFDYDKMQLVKMPFAKGHRASRAAQARIRSALARLDRNAAKKARNA